MQQVVRTIVTEPIWYKVQPSSLVTLSKRRCWRRLSDTPLPKSPDYEMLLTAAVLRMQDQT